MKINTREGEINRREEALRQKGIKDTTEENFEQNGEIVTLDAFKNHPAVISLVEALKGKIYPAAVQFVMATFPPEKFISSAMMQERGKDLGLPLGDIRTIGRYIHQIRKNSSTFIQAESAVGQEFPAKLKHKPKIIFRITPQGRDDTKFLLNKIKRNPFVEKQIAGGVIEA